MRHPLPIILLAGLLTAAGPAVAAPYSALYAFGDSLSDAGNLFIGSEKAFPLPPYSQGRFSNGPTWVQNLSVGLGLGLLTPSLSGGTNYAFGGAETGDTPVNSTNDLDLPSQLRQYLQAHPTPQPNALYTLWIGSNDLYSVLESPDPSKVAQATIAAAIGNIKTFIDALEQAGTRHLLVVNVADLGTTPKAAKIDPAEATKLSVQFDAALEALLRAEREAGVLDLRALDSFSLIEAAVTNPERFGFTDVTTPCWTGNYQGENGTLCSPDLAVQNTHLFWDYQHPTERAHELIGAAALEVVVSVPEPGSLSLLGVGLAIMAWLRRRPRTAGWVPSESAPESHR